MSEQTCGTYANFASDPQDDSLGVCFVNYYDRYDTFKAVDKDGLCCCLYKQRTDNRNFDKLGDVAVSMYISLVDSMFHGNQISLEDVSRYKQLKDCGVNT